MSSPPEVLSDQKILNRWQSCPFEYVLACHFVHPNCPAIMIELRFPIMKAFSFFTCRVYTVQASALYRRVDSTVARHSLPLTRMDTWWLFQNLWRGRPKDALALAILLCISSSVHPLVDIVLPRWVNSRTEFSLFPSTMISWSRVLVVLGWYRTSVFLMLIFRPNFFDASEKASTILCISSAKWATNALSSANSSSLISIRVVLVFALKCATLNRSGLCLDCM